MLRKRIYSAIESALCNRTAHTYDSINVSQSLRNSPRPRLVIEEVLKTVHRRWAGKALIYVGSVGFVFALWRDDLRVVRYRCVGAWRDYQLLENPGFSCGFQNARGRHGGRLSSLNLICDPTKILCAFVPLWELIQWLSKCLILSQSPPRHKVMTPTKTLTKKLFALSPLNLIGYCTNTLCLRERPIHTLEFNERYLRANNRFIVD